jgi:predicted tellurium resistance membrane protein TerC
MNSLLDPQIWLSLLTLTVLEIVLGVDNIIFISILSGKLPRAQQQKGRMIGLALALITRVLLLASIFWLTHLTAALFTAFGRAFSGRDLVLLVGGLFLMWKSVHEIHEDMEGGHGEDEHGAVEGSARMGPIIVQIMLIDIVFSIDSVITAVGIAQVLWVMITAVVLAMIVMMVASGAIADFVNRHAPIKMLALAFLLLVGIVLVADGMGQHISRGYIYFAMAFSFGVEMLNLRRRTKRRVRTVSQPH